MTLYEINAQFAEAIELYENGIDEVVDTETGEVKSLADVLAELNMSREQKIENTVRYIKNLHADSESARAEASNLVERADRFDKKAEQLESYLLSQLGDCKKMETPLYTLKVRTSKSTFITFRTIFRYPVRNRLSNISLFILSSTTFKDTIRYI